MAAGDFTRAMGTPICWADETDYDDTASGIARTHQIDLTSLAATDAWQGAKADLGATRPPAYAVKLCIEMDVAPTAGGAVELYWSSSYSGVAGTGNDGGAESAGADSDWDGIAGGAAAERGEYKNHLIFIGQLGVGADADIPMVKTVNPYFVPPTRYGFPILINNTTQAFQGDAVEMYIALIPILENIAAS
jgi:hypothetical protein